MRKRKRGCGGKGGLWGWEWGGDKYGGDLEVIGQYVRVQQKWKIYNDDPWEWDDSPSNQELRTILANL